MIKGIILAAGQSSRFGREDGFGKCFTHVGGGVLLENSIKTLRDVGVESIIIGINPKDESVAENIFRKYNNVEIKLSTSKGTAGCLIDVITPAIERAVVLYGDTVYRSSINNFYGVFQKLNKGRAAIGVQQTENLENYMAIVEEKDGYVPLIKPHGLKTGLAYVGLFGFNDRLIMNKLSELEFSRRGELELTDLIKKYASSKALDLGFYNSSFVDCNTKEKISDIIT